MDRKDNQNIEIRLTLWHGQDDEIYNDIELW